MAEAVHPPGPPGHAHGPPGPPGAAATASDGRAWRTLAMVSLGVVMVQIDATIVNVALPSIREDLGFLEVSVSELQWVVNAYALSLGVLLLTGGKLADLLGRKRIFLTGLVIFTGASVACGASNDINVLIGFRALQGVGAAMVLPTSLAIIQVTFPPEKLGVALGIWSSIVGAGTALGPLLGGILSEEVDWRWVFYVNVPVGIITFVGTLIWVGESRSPFRGRLDYAGILISGAALFALIFGLLKGNEFGWGDPRTIGCLAGGVLGLVVFVWVESRQESPMLDITLFRSPTFSGANVTAVTVGFALFGLLFFGSLETQNVMNFSPIQTGASLMPMVFLSLLLAPIVGKVMGKTGPRPLLTVGMALLAISLALFGLLLEYGANFWSMTPGLVTSGIGFALVLTPLTAAALSGVPVQQSGMGAAVINSTRQIGGALGLAVMGAISAELVAGLLVEGDSNNDAFADSFDTLMYLGAAVSALGAIVAWLTIAPGVPRRPGPPGPPGGPPGGPPQVQVEQPRSFALSTPSVVSALPEDLKARAGPRVPTTLEVIAGPAAGTQIELTGDQLVIGRGEDGVGQLGSDPEISRRHATISRRDARLVVEDLGSMNGTLVNGRRISEPTPARPGDSIELGSSKLRVLEPTAPPPGPPGLLAAAGGTSLELEIADGPAAGTRVLIGDRPVVFGRAEHGVRSLGEDRDLSRRHASVSVLDATRLLLEDLGSTNGTFLNSQRIAAPTVAQLGDAITLGSTTIKVVALGGGGPGGAAPSAESELSPASEPGT